MFCFVVSCKNKTSNVICEIRLELTNDVDCFILCFRFFVIMINSFIHVRSLIKQTHHFALNLEYLRSSVPVPAWVPIWLEQLYFHRKTVKTETE